MTRNLKEKWHPYAGKWIARIGNQMITHAGTPWQAVRLAKSIRYKEKIDAEYSPLPFPLVYPGLLYQIQKLLENESEVYLVGGAVRDAILGIPIHDLDFVVASHAQQIARHLAEHLNAAIFPLDDKRETYRVIYMDNDQNRTLIDIAVLREKSFEEDLLARDFTINSMAVNLIAPQELLDPLGGLNDLRNGVLRSCSDTAMDSDPIRIIRAIRLAAEFNFQIHTDTRQLMAQSIKSLNRVSSERIRDEIFKILAGRQPSKAFKALDWLGVVEFLFPELSQTKEINQPSLHIHDVWAHTLQVMESLVSILALFGIGAKKDSANNLYETLILTKLGRFKQSIVDHFNTSPNIDRPALSLLLFAALYHDSGKPNHFSLGDNGKIHFYHHEQSSAKLVAQRGGNLSLSNVEISYLETIVRYHMRIHWMAANEGMPSRRTIYRYFTDSKENGVDIGFLTLADLISTHGPELSVALLERYLNIINLLFEEWWTDDNQLINPTLYLDGNDLQRIYQLNPGPLIGRLLSQLREAQASGVVNNCEEALGFIAELLKDNA